MLDNDNKETATCSIVENEELHPKKERSNNPNFQLTACHYQIIENGPWYVGIIVNTSDMILTRNGRLLTRMTINDIQLDEDMLVLELGPIIKCIEEQQDMIYGHPNTGRVCKADPFDSIKTINEL